jgi:hypothetical protein
MIAQRHVALTTAQRHVVAMRLVPSCFSLCYMLTSGVVPLKCSGDVGIAA